MAILHDTTLWVYNLTLLPIMFFSVLFIIFALLRLLAGDKKERFAKQKTPFVSVQVPTFNDPIAARCVERCLKFDYPADKYEIIIVDDSTNKETQKLMRAFTKHKNVKYVHRDNREGFKPGALRNAMKFTKGEIIVLFDADWIPRRNFLKEVVKPFADPKVAIVQTRQGFYNHDKNLITRFAAYTLMVYHSIMMPLNNRANCVFFCGTAGALRRSALESVGGWNTESITEDSDLSVRLLVKKYKTAYVDIETPSEVPETFEGFIKQQMRWTYGNARVFIDNAPSIIYRPGLTLGQRLLITYITLGTIIAPVVVLMTVFGFAGWFTGDPRVFQLADLSQLVLRMLLTAGFLIVGALTLYRQKRLKEFGYLTLSAVTIGVIISVANTFALTKAFTNKGLGWFCTPKKHNKKLVSE